MGESKYFIKLDKLIESIINCNPKDILSLKNDGKKCFDNIYSNFTNNSINEQSSNFENIYTNYFIRNLRLKYQKETFNNISNENIIISKAKIICEYILWLIQETKNFSFQQILKFLQDIIETIPFSGIEQIFNLVCEYIGSSKLNSLNKDDKDGKLNILFLQNIFLKRINNNLNNELRGKILLFFCNFFSIDEKSGTNKNGKYSKNQVNDELSNYSNDNSDTVINDEDGRMDIDENTEKNITLSDKGKDNNNINNNEDKNNNSEEKKKNKIEIEEIKKINNDLKEIKEKNEDEKDNIKDNKIKDENNNNEKGINKELNQKIIFYEQFWKIEKILINPFMVCKLFYNLYNNKLFYFIAV